MFLPLVAGEERGAESSHQAADIGTHRFPAGNKLEGAEYRIVVKGAALHNNFFPNSSGIPQLDYLKERIFDNRIRKPCGNISDGCAFLLRLFYAAVHKDRTAASEVDGLRRKERLCGKVGNRHTERTGKIVQKAAAA